jgi:DNA polymerase-3 subunit gamma/tau
MSRCQRFDFKKLINSNIEKQIKYILKCENRKLNEDVIKLIAVLSNGGLRDAINMVDQLLSINKEDVVTDDVYNLVGDISDVTVFELMDKLVSSDIKSVLELINELYENGKSFINVCDRLQMLVRNIIIYNNTNDYFEKEYEKKLDSYMNVDVDKCSKISEELFTLSNELKKTSNQKTLMEIYFIKMLLIFSKDNKLIEQNNEEHIEKEMIVLEKNEKLDISYKNIRINNTLAEADKDLKKKMLDEYSIIREYLSSKEYNSIANLLLKGVPEVVSSRNILFTFKNSFEVVLFDKNIEDIQKFLKFIFNKKYALTAVNKEDWESIKNDYILLTNEGKKYKYIPEENVQKQKNKKTTVLQNTVENIFGEDYVEIN